MSASVPVMDNWRPVVPQLTIATGVVAVMPLAIRVCAIWPMCSVPIITTFVPGFFASVAQFTTQSLAVGSSWPVRMVSCEQ